MDLQSAIILTQSLVVLFPALWLSIGVYSNICRPDNNRDYIIRVMGMGMAVSPPYDKIYHSHFDRRIQNLSICKTLFFLLVCYEFIVCCGLWLAGAGLLFALAGEVSVATARTISICSVLGFTSIWCAFLIAGEWFVYWASDESPQKTHFFMTLWGLVTLLVLMQ